MHVVQSGRVAVVAAVGGVLLEVMVGVMVGVVGVGVVGVGVVGVHWVGGLHLSLVPSEGGGEYGGTAGPAGRPGRGGARGRLLLERASTHTLPHAQQHRHQHGQDQDQEHRHKPNSSAYGRFRGTSGPCRGGLGRCLCGVSLLLTARLTWQGENIRMSLSEEHSSQTKKEHSSGCDVKLL